MAMAMAMAMAPSPPRILTKVPPGTIPTFYTITIVLFRMVKMRCIEQGVSGQGKDADRCGKMREPRISTSKDAGGTSKDAEPRISISKYAEFSKINPVWTTVGSF